MNRWRNTVHIYVYTVGSVRLKDVYEKYTNGFYIVFVLIRAKVSLKTLVDIV